MRRGKCFLLIVILLFMSIPWGKETKLQARSDRQWYMDSIDWEDSTGEEPQVVVAVIDTGVGITHPALENSLWINEKEKNGTEGVDDDGNGYVDDVYGYNVRGDNNDVTDTAGHGTHIAGIIAMQEITGNQASGVYPKAKIMAIRAGYTVNGFSSKNLIKAVRYAIENGADVINMSLGTSYCSEELQEILEEASKSCVIVAAAGNLGLPTAESGKDRMENCFPAGLSCVTGVMAHDKNGELSAYSNWDFASGEGADYDVVAPGDEIYATTKAMGYKEEFGTSMATAVVSATCAKLIGLWKAQPEQYRKYSPDWIRECICKGNKEEVLYTDEDGQVHKYPKLSMRGAREYMELHFSKDADDSNPPGDVEAATGAAVESMMPITEASLEPSSEPSSEISPEPSVSSEPEESPRPSESPEPEESPRPSESMEPEESSRPSESMEPEESPRPSESPEPGEIPRASESPEYEKSPESSKGPNLEERKEPELSKSAEFSQESETTERSLQKGNTDRPGKIRKITATFQRKKLKVMTGTVKGADGYEIVLSTDRRRKEIVGKKNSVRGSAVFTKRKRKESYYVTVRAYKKTKDGGFLYGIGKTIRVKTR